MNVFARNEKGISAKTEVMIYDVKIATKNARIDSGRCEWPRRLVRREWLAVRPRKRGEGGKAVFVLSQKSSEYIFLYF